MNLARFCITTSLAATLAITMGFMFQAIDLILIGGILAFYAICILIEVIDANEAPPATGEASYGEVQHLESIERRNTEPERRGPGRDRDPPRDVGQSRGAVPAPWRRGDHS